LKDLHRHALLEAYLSIAQGPRSTVRHPLTAEVSSSHSQQTPAAAEAAEGTGEEGTGEGTGVARDSAGEGEREGESDPDLAEMDTNSPSSSPLDLQEEEQQQQLQQTPHGNLSLPLERFLSWEQIASVISDGVLTETIVRENFLQVLHSQSQSQRQPQLQSQEELSWHSSHETGAEGDEERDGEKAIAARDDRDSGGVSFEGFCVLMERLEYLAGEAELKEEGLRQQQQQQGRGGQSQGQQQGSEVDDVSQEASEDDEEEEEGPISRDIIKRRRQSVLRLEL
jgi:hypothetical protein